MRWWTVMLLVATLAGCADDGDEPERQDAFAVPDLVAHVGAVTNGTNVTFDVVAHAGPAPANWTLDADGDGTPDHNGTGNGTVVHAYAAGNHTATLTASWGNQTANSTANILIAPPMDAAPEDGNGTGNQSAAPLPTGQETTVSWPGGNLAPGCLGDIFGVPYPEDLDGTTFQSFPIEAHTIGYAYTATVTSTGLSGGDVGLAFLDDSWGTIVSGFISSTGEGEVPEGAAFGVFWSCYYVGNSGTFVSTPA